MGGFVLWLVVDWGNLHHYCGSMHFCWVAGSYSGCDETWIPDFFVVCSRIYQWHFGRHLQLLCSDFLLPLVQFVL